MFAVAGSPWRRFKDLVASMYPLVVAHKWWIASKRLVMTTTTANRMCARRWKHS
jgi:hypothetical protein